MASLYERLGGDLAVSAVSEILYSQIYEDEELKVFFEGVDRELIVQKQIDFLKHILGGPQMDHVFNLGSIHAPLVERGLNLSHYNSLVSYLETIMTELGVAKADVKEAISIIDTFKNSILKG